jgi:pilus assembly protein Flp/PilA
MSILNATKNMIADFAREEEGAQIVEYGMIIGAISLVLIGLLATLKDGNYSGLVGKVQACLGGDCSATPPAAP